MADTYREGFDSKWPGDQQAGQPVSRPSMQDTADLAGTIQEPGDPMDAHDTLRDLNANLGEPPVPEHPIMGTAGWKGKSDEDMKPGDKLQTTMEDGFSSLKDAVKDAMGGDKKE